MIYHLVRFVPELPGSKDLQPRLSEIEPTAHWAAPLALQATLLRSDRHNRPLWDAEIENEVGTMVFVPLNLEFVCSVSVGLSKSREQRVVGLDARKPPDLCEWVEPSLYSLTQWMSHL
jgi:hypothetical protein